MLIKEDQDLIGSYLEDSSNLKGGFAEAVVIPESVTELIQAVEEANRRRQSITVSGGGTGTTGSRIPFGGIVISLERLNDIDSPDVAGRSVSAQAGALVEDVKKRCEEAGLFYPCHPTERTAFLGGTIATNASGARSFKYGPTRKYVKGLKMVLSTGEALEVRRGEKFLTARDSSIKLAGGRVIEIPLPRYKMPRVKNSAGYFVCGGSDLIDLFIGQEGTLSIITDIGLALEKLPFKIFSSFLFFDREEDSWNFALEARKRGALSIEYFDKNALKLLGEGKNSVPAGSEGAIFFESEMTEEGEERSTEEWMGVVERHKVPLDRTWAAMTPEDAENFNTLRHSIPEAINDIVRRRGFGKLSTDIAVPEKNFVRMMRVYTGTLSSAGIEHVMFGHIGECHIHVNLLPRSGEELERSRQICLGFVKEAVALGGTVSAEHGIGKTRRGYLELMYGREGVMEMARIKKALDPGCILGPGNIFTGEVLDSV